ncbi:Ribonuclease H-like protein [Cordyceps javanica]|uniref:Ribonuclease H-like protein n=1 Tax=Cordyceps javanica TaxID=43265 RepID=A0A545UNG7_9HYPO|nr:Ribonuclease H-like protein [Cordyceps javanica]TQW01621.1 Ribonuclease H-like protein [Cordyceps javanica]TQW02748.1 Ribonuclease H-like protein [Cordyceps javanica]
MESDLASLLSTPSSPHEFINIEKCFRREKAKPRNLYVCLFCTFKPWKDPYRGNARRHLKSAHPSLMELYGRRNHSQQSLDSFITSSTTPSETALRNAFNRQAYIEALVSLLTRRRVAFSMVEWDELKELALACNPAIEDGLVTSRRTIMRYVSANYQLYASQLVASLRSAVSMIHLSSDLWTSPHRHGMLAVCGQWVDKSYTLRKALLGLLECRGDHSGAYQASLIAKVLEKFEIRRVGYHTGDNASSNNTCLEALSKILGKHDIDFNPIRRRVRCFGHVLNLCLQAFLLAYSKEALSAALATASVAPGAKSMEAFSATLSESDFPVSHLVAGYAPSQNQSQSQHRRLNTMPAAKQTEFSGWEGVAALQKLHHLAVWIRSSPLHSDRWREVVGQNLGIDNATRWSSWYRVINNALSRKPQVVQFMVDNDQDIGSDYVLTGADWDILSKTHTFLQPFTEATLLTEGDKASICSTLRLMDGLLSHFKKAKAHYSSDKFYDGRMLHSIEMGWFVLNKYYTLSDEAPVYAAALLLDPGCRKAYLTKNWKAEWIEPAIEVVRQQWEEEYRGSVGHDSELADDTSVSEQKPPSQLQLLLQEMEVDTATATDGDNLDSFVNAPAIKIDCTPLEWWCRVEQRRQFPSLSRMAIDILSISPQSAEPERTFSGARRTASWDRLSMTCERIEEVECVGNWLRNGHIVASQHGGPGLVCDPDIDGDDADMEASEYAD